MFWSGLSCRNVYISYSYIFLFWTDLEFCAALCWWRNCLPINIVYVFCGKFRLKWNYRLVRKLTTFFLRTTAFYKCHAVIQPLSRRLSWNKYSCSEFRCCFELSFPVRSSLILVTSQVKIKPRKTQQDPIESSTSLWLLYPLLCHLSHVENEWTDPYVQIALKTV